MTVDSIALIMSVLTLQLVSIMYPPFDSVSLISQALVKLGFTCLLPDSPAEYIVPF